VDQRLAVKARDESSPNKASLKIEKISPTSFSKMRQKLPESLRLSLTTVGVRHSLTYRSGQSTEEIARYPSCNLSPSGKLHLK
jgi:hypothetical protein